MYQTENDDKKVYVFCPDGRVICYRSYDSLLKNIEVPRTHYPFVSISQGLADYRFCTKFGHVISLEKIVEDLRTITYIEREKRICAKNGYIFRQTPVPHVHGWRGGGGFLRYPKTTQEKRWADAWKDQGVKARARRNRRNLPDAWDDICRSDCSHRSWKRHRRYQWKEKRLHNGGGSSVG